MTEPLFKKAVTLTDCHFGRKANSPQANQDNLDFIEWFVEEAKTWGADTCIMMGDWNDNRASLGVQTMNASLRAMEMLNAAFKNIYWITGNHDLFYRENRRVNSIEFAKHLDHITIVRDPMTLGDVTLLPWLVGNEAKKLKTLKSRYIFGHLEVGGMMMNSKVALPETEDGLKASEFTNQDYVFSGHFHLRQSKGRLLYTGNIMPFDFSDSGDADKGMMLLEWGKEPEFRAWPLQPLFSTMRLSDLLSAPQRHLKSRMTARVGIDIDISYEEAQIIKDTFLEEYDLRRMELVPMAKTQAEQQFIGDVVFQSVDQIVIDGLMSIQSIGMKPDTLVDIYKSLPNI